MLEINAGYEVNFAIEKVEQLRIGIVQARINQSITDNISRACHDELLRLGVLTRNINLVEVPGVSEVPFACQALADNFAIDVIIAIGCIIRGETIQFKLIATNNINSLTQISLEQGLPIINAVLPLNDIKQAKERSQIKGAEIARSAIEMALLAKNLQSNSEFLLNE